MDRGIVLSIGHHHAQEGIKGGGLNLPSPFSSPKAGLPGVSQERPIQKQAWPKTGNLGYSVIRPDHTGFFNNPIHLQQTRKGGSEGTMDAVVKLIAERTGLPESTVQPVVEAVLAVLKERLPDPIAAQVERVLLEGEEGIDFDDIAKGLSSLFGQ